MKPVAIVGGGITGLTAAFRLQQAGIPVVLFEAGGRTGGVIRSVRQEGYLAEFGPNSLLETSPKISELIRDLDLESRRWYSDPAAEKRYLVRGGKTVELPGSPSAFFRTPLFSASAKLRLLREPLVRRAPVEVEESLAEFVKRRIGQEFLDYAINPFVAGVYAGDPAKLSVKHAFPKLHALEQRYGSLILGQIFGARERKRRGEVSKQDAKKISFDEGLQVLTDRLRERLGASVHLDSRVHQVTEVEGGWHVTSGPEDGLKREEFSAVLLATTASQVASLTLQTHSGVSLAPLQEMYYPPVASLVLGFRRDEVEHPLDGFGMLIPEVEKFHILGTLFSSSLFPKRAPDGHVTLTSYLGGVRNPGLASRSRDELVELTVEDLRRLLGVRGRPTFVHHCYYSKAIPQYDVGFGRFRELMDKTEAQAGGLFLAGHYRDGISLSDSILSAHAAADRVSAFLGATPGANTERAAIAAETGS